MKGHVFSAAKVSTEVERIQAYLKGERIFPLTIELDLTQLCTRVCPGCPYSVSKRAGLTLNLSFLDRLFGILGQNTPGIVLSGGEPTLVPHFPETLALARKKGFKEVAVITNGSRLDDPKVVAALLEYATAVRVSLYDWQTDESEYFLKELKNIEKLRSLIDKTGSKLEIGASMLTRNENISRFMPVGKRAVEAGIDWLYFHPYCVDWELKLPKQADQEGVLEAIEDLKKAIPDANIQVPVDRYLKQPLYFEKMHGSHFLIQVGADGINYAGPECKYEKEYNLLNLNEYLDDDFLWHPERIEKLNQINSENFTFISTKHRPPMFSDYIQKIIDGKIALPPNNGVQEEFAYPHII